MISKEENLVALSPPAFEAECTVCKLWRKQLPWQVSVNGGWGAVCTECGKSILVQQLRSKLPDSFSKLELFEAILPFGVNRLEAELLISDFEKEGLIAPSAEVGRQAHEKGFCYIERSLNLGKQAVAAKDTPRDTAPGKPSISMLPSTIRPLENYCWREPTAVEPLAQPKKRRHRTWRALSRAEVFERCRRLSRELMEAGQG